MDEQQVKRLEAQAYYAVVRALAASNKLNFVSHSSAASAVSGWWRGRRARGPAYALAPSNPPLPSALACRILRPCSWTCKGRLV